MNQTIIEGEHKIRRLRDYVITQLGDYAITRLRDYAITHITYYTYYILDKIDL